MFDCLNTCDLQCWAIENTAAIDRQQAGLTQTAEDQANERQAIEGHYADVIDEATAAGDDPELLALAHSYARFDRTQQEREDSTQAERDQREDVFQNIILANGSLALRTCSGSVDGLCTGEVKADDRSMLRSYLYQSDGQ